MTSTAALCESINALRAQLGHVPRMEPRPGGWVRDVYGPSFWPLKGSNHRPTELPEILRHLEEAVADRAAEAHRRLIAQTLRSDGILHRLRRIEQLQAQRRVRIKRATRRAGHLEAERIRAARAQVRAWGLSRLCGPDGEDILT